MRVNKIQLHPAVYYLPTICMIAFIVLYVVAAQYYPGGSYKNRFNEGFSWTYNYWCNLLGKYALNGQQNGARPFALAGTAFLCGGIGLFYTIFSRFFVVRAFWKKAIEIFGVGSMIFALFLFTPYHDLVLTIAGISGLIALIGTMRALLTSNSYSMLWMGGFCLFLILANTYMYYANIFIFYLPAFQKISMLIVILWMVLLNHQFAVVARKD